MIFEILEPQRTPSCWKRGILILSKYFAISFKTLSPLFMGDDNVLHINSSDLQRLWQHGTKPEPRQTHGWQGRPRCHSMCDRFKLETHSIWVTISSCPMISTYTQAQPKIQSIPELIYLFDAKNPDIWKPLDNWFHSSRFICIWQSADFSSREEPTMSCVLKTNRENKTLSLPSFSRITFPVLLLLWSTFSVFFYFPPPPVCFF